MPEFGIINLMRNSLIKHTFILTLLVGLLDFFGNKFYLYWSVSWFDMVMHFLAGVLIAFFVCLFAHYVSLTGYATRKTLYMAIGFSIFVGLIWEWYELYFELTFIEDGFLYYRDTVSDLFLDILGTVLGFIYIKRLK